MENEIGFKFFFWIGTAVMLLSVLTVVLFVLLHRNKVAKIKRKESENLLRISLESEKRERKRIASDLHDGISGDLHAMQNYITILQNREDNDDRIALFKEIETILSSTLENIQGISYNLMPPTLESQGLVPTLQSYFERVRKWNRISFSARYDHIPIEIPAADSYELYRIVQELLANITKHNDATHIDFSIINDQGQIIIEMVDNGKSFDFFKSLREPGGMGLKNITSRVSQIRGKLIQVPSATGNKIKIYYNVTDRNSR
ncbi:sensor histidine kinase [Chryseobacterium sp. CBSDS_008]|uniref:sensor histidine kinase n=1 Tax=Chryseobacterium sp. CBSDS_008 TaxID=3415265 RepID=UPI003CEB76AD